MRRGPGVDDAAAMARAKNDVEEEDPAEAPGKVTKRPNDGARITDFTQPREEGLATTCGPPARLRHPKALWNGDRPALCKLTRAWVNPIPAARECFLSRNYTEGFKKPTAFKAGAAGGRAAANRAATSRGPGAGPVGRERHRPGPAGAVAVPVRGARGQGRGNRAGTQRVHRAVNALKIVCRNALGARPRPNAAMRSCGAWTRPAAPTCVVSVIGEPSRLTARMRWRSAAFRGAAPTRVTAAGRGSRRRDMAEHRASCDHRLVGGEHPGCDRMTQARYAVSHARLCENRPFACPNRPRCEWMGTRADASPRITSRSASTRSYPADSSTVSRMNARVPAAVTLPRVQMLAHKEICRYQSAVCKYCGESMALRRHGQHEATCSARFYECPNCAQTVHKLRKVQHDGTVCPGVRVECMYRSYGCDERVLKCDYARHCRERFDEHAVMVLRNDANKWARPASSAPGDEPSDPRPDEPEASNPTGKSDGFEVMVTRHELTRADLQRVDATSQRLSAGLDREIASAREEIARVEDEVYVDATARLALDMRSAREHMRALVKETDDEVQAFETKLMAETLELYNDSQEAMRRKAERELAVKTSLDEFVTGYERGLREVRAELGDLTREVGESTLRLSTAISPALELKDEIERTLVEGLDGLEARIANLEWRGADRAAIAWEKTQDARENFRARCKPRVRQQMRLEEKMALLEGRKFVTPDEDAALRAKNYVDLEKNSRRSRSRRMRRGRRGCVRG